LNSGFRQSDKAYDCYETIKEDIDLMKDFEKNSQKYFKSPKEMIIIVLDAVLLIRMDFKWIFIIPTMLFFHGFQCPNTFAAGIICYMAE
jgi:hypothetical protein